MGDSCTLKVKYKNTVFEIQVKPEETTIKDLKRAVYLITNLKQHRQAFSNLQISGNENTLIKDLNLDSNFILEICDIQSEPVSTISTGDLASGFSGMKVSSFHHEGGGDRPSVVREFKVLSEPRKGKLLVVLDIDKTIYDGSAPSTHFAARPHLKELLTTVYKYYNIGIWSATNMNSIERKLQLLSMTDNPDYNLLFLMDVYAMVPIPIAGEMYKVKPLDMVYARYPQFNRKNTVICDDVEYNFYLNTRNGILVAPYTHRNYQSDIELLQLTEYLKNIATCDNISALDHKLWKQTVSGMSGL